MKRSRIKYWIGNHAYGLGHLAPAYGAVVFTFILAATALACLLVWGGLEKSGGIG